ncbi:MAG: hypothetical protein ABSE18_03580 [Minisyncoccia bacterium]|jgi:hypothetical protein
MAIRHDKGVKYITLKEAAKLSGYAPDYLGQLIRKGKLQGKQIYLNVAWVTTEEAIREYMAKSGAERAIPAFKEWVREKLRTWWVANSSTEAILRLARRIIYVLVVLLFLFIAFLIYAFITIAIAKAATGVPLVLSYQGRLFDSNGNLLGGSGTPYCFRFSIYDSLSGGTKLWPSTTASAMTATVANGVFDVGVGDVSAGGDPLTFNFQSNDTAYLNVEVAAQVSSSCTNATFEALSPRERIVASGYAINAATVGGFAPSQNATGTEIPVLASGALVLGDANPQINATGTNTLTLQGGTGTGAIQFFSASNTIASSGILTIANRVTASMLQATATSSQFVFQGTGATGTLSWNPTVVGALTIPNFATATDTVALVNYSQTLNNKTLNAPSVTAGMSIVQNAASTGLTLSQNGTGIALSIVNAPTSTQATSTVAITAGANVSGAALIVSNFGSGNAIQVNDASSTVFYVNSVGNAVFLPSSDTSTTFALQNASGTITLLAADTLNNKIKIGRNGAAGSVPTLLGLDVKSDAGDPTGFNGAMYYSSSTGSFRCYQGGAWTNCIPTPIGWQQDFGTNQWGYWAPTGTAATVFTAVDMGIPTVNGTAAASAQAEDYYVQWTSAASNGSVGGLTQTFNQTQPRYTPRFATRIRTDTTITSRRIWVALNSAAITGSDVAAGATSTVFFGLRYSTSAGDTTWQCGSGDGTTASYTNTGVTVTTSTYYDIILDMSTAGQMLCQVATNGGSYVTTPKTTNIATGATQLGITDAVTTLTGTAAVHRIAYVYFSSHD